MQATDSPTRDTRPHHQRVKAVYPRAFYQDERVYHWPSGRFVRAECTVYEFPGGPILAHGNTPAQAWRHAWDEISNP